MESEKGLLNDIGPDNDRKNSGDRERYIPIPNWLIISLILW